MIQVRNLSKYFENKIGIEDISIDYEPGKCTTIIGPSGSGKTVLLKTTVGLIAPDSGKVIFDNVIFNKLKESEQKQIRSKMGMLFQGSALFDFATALENVMFPMDFFTKMSREEKIERAMFCLNRVGLENVEKKYPSELSGGMQKRVGIARAIAIGPSYLFCDEPNSGLDPYTSTLIDRLIQEITQEYNITTIINTHDMNSVMEIADKIVFIYKGKKEWEGCIDDIFTSDNERLNDFVFATNMAKELRKALKTDKGGHQI